MEGFDKLPACGRKDVNRAAGESGGAESQNYLRTTEKGVVQQFYETARPWYSSGELKRRKRIAEYKLYSVEGKMKNRLRKGFRWGQENLAPELCMDSDHYPYFFLSYY
ncbi:hypothetical protein Salat_1531000 [Sesamum alatum]|uniref:Uncharacterized protein n=1 Tax=Sesamum alatum TaxID=300844 RepID=A0AAE1YCJ1_9LAMI|nr:hypothetical protein Salat_1531000 [Sesamum alatum]